MIGQLCFSEHKLGMLGNKYLIIQYLLIRFRAMIPLKNMNKIDLKCLYFILVLFFSGIMVQKKNELLATYMLDV